MPTYVDYRNPSATDWIEAGTVVDVGKRAHVAHVDIPPSDASKKDDPSHLAAFGGVYEGLAAAALSPGASVDYDIASERFVAAGSGGVGFGYVEAGSEATAADQIIRVVHMPNPTP
jgi:hypothetical protein